MKYNEHTGFWFIILTLITFVGAIIAFTYIVLAIIDKLNVERILK
jgi:hypothetical protein